MQQAVRHRIRAHSKRLLDLAASIGHDARDNDETALRKRVAVVLFGGTLPLTIAWSAIYLAVGAPLAAAVPGFYSVITPINTVIFAHTRNLGIYRFTQLLLVLILPWLVMISLGGFRQSSAVVLWAALSPLGALLIDDLRGTPFWTAGFIALLIIGAILEPYLPQANLPQAFIATFYILNIGAVISIAFGLLYYFVDRRNFFHQRAEMLLLNILPKEISEALKAAPRTIADEDIASSILFADVVEFTPMAAAMTLLQLVDLLNEVFQCFDGLVEKYDLEKIKTIGDCYMVASAVPCPRPDHAVALVNLALDMQAVIAEHRFGGRQLAFRIGINSDPVVAGVIGRKKFIYELWGETVNLASRMESHGRSRCVQITRSTYDLIKDSFDCEALGLIDVKGAGPTKVWHVIGRKPALAA
ncbi:MAG: adenylate/guanylate cyclase domain-containing protein [Xanthobacteraceae bacterium]